MNDQQLESTTDAQNGEPLQLAVAEHLGWVYGAALRQVHDHHLAEDVAQAVFLLLARKANSMPRNTRLTGWLFRAVRYCSQNALKLQRRRQFYEKRSATRAVDAPEQDWWNQVRPVVDDAVARLSRADRELVLARYYLNQPYEKIGQERSLSPEAARKRVGRAFDQLRLILRARSAELPAEADRLLARSIASAAPAGLAGAIAASAKAGAPASVATLTAMLSKSFALAKAKVAAAVAAIALTVSVATVVATRPATPPVAAATAPAVAVAPAPKPASAPPAPLPAVALTTARENAVYVSFRVLMDEAVLDQFRKIGTTLTAPAGFEQWSCDNEVLRQFLHDNFNDGVIADRAYPTVAAGADKPRPWNRRLVGDWGVFASTQIPGEPWSYLHNGLSLFTARASAGKVMLSLVETSQPTLRRNGTPAPAISPRTLSASATIALGTAFVQAELIGNTDQSRWYQLTVVQTFPADVVDAQFLAIALSMPMDKWLSGSARQWLIDARRSSLWYAKLPATDAARWRWSPPGETGKVKLREVTDSAVSPSMAWSPDGGRCVDSRLLGPGGESAGPKLKVALLDGREETIPLSSPGPITLGIGHGKFTRIGVVAVRDGTVARIAGHDYCYRRATVFYDNEPATDIAFVPLDKNGKEIDRLESGLWTSEMTKAATGVTSHVLFVSDKTASIGIYTRPRAWHTFEGIAPRPALEAPTDAQVLASFAKPLDLPIPPQDLDQYVDPFVAAHAKTLFMQMDAGPMRLRWFGDDAGREYFEGMGYRTVTDGVRCYRWADGIELPTIAHWSQDTAKSPAGAFLFASLLRISSQFSQLREIAQEQIDGIHTTVYEGSFQQTQIEKVRVWKDDSGRAMRSDLPSSVVSVRYDLPDDRRWFAVPEAIKSRPADDEKGLEIARALSERPAIMERQDGPRLFRLHEVLTGEDGTRLVCYSTQLNPKAADLLRFAPYGRNWGRGWISAAGFEKVLPYGIVPVARIDAPDRSIRWYILLPQDKTADKAPWHINVEMNPTTPNAVPLLESAGFSSFGTIEFDLPKSANAQPIQLDEYLNRVYADVHSYSAAMPPQSDEVLKPSGGNESEFAAQVRKDIETARAGGFLSFPAN